MKNQANSVPIAPAPMMAIRSGRLSSTMASRLEITLSPSISTPGIERARPPVARMTLSASRVSVPSADSTATFFPGVSLPRPRKTATRFFFIRNLTPLARPPEISRLLAISRSQS